jgi:hypothetical protein
MELDPGEIPSATDLGFAMGAFSNLNIGSTRAGSGSGSSRGMDMQGGETRALAHLQEYVAEFKRNVLAVGGEGKARSGLQEKEGSAFSCKISPWLVGG